ncbi:MAG: hypothetical protein B6244_00305 [Candidatus Cloacimonetes bacterium 4572_55]|nr:MAG: hypothetical protein B6244_00305 [Candidatus Cloacimonetes bacterium 4572_55]
MTNPEIEKKLENRRIVLGITGGIAAYKSCYLIRELIKREATVQVIMTRSAQRFITSLTLETLSRNPVVTDMFDDPGAFGPRHIEIAQSPDLMVVAPATYNIMGKVANGIADDFLSTAISASCCPIFFAPAMNNFMFKNPIMQENLAKLKRHYRLIMPESGDLACGYSGEGRMAEPETICQMIDQFFHPNPIWADKTVLVTAGPTREKIDPVRFISNFSSGKMGFALAQASERRGARTILISGPVHLPTPDRVRRIQVQTAEEMREAVLRELPNVDVAIKSAAVSDYQPSHYASQKIKKGNQEQIELALKKTPDILSEISEKKSDRTIVVGFALETDSEIEHARQKMIKKNLDMIVINNPNIEGAGFQVDTNLVTLMSRNHQIESLPLLTKRKVAEKILNRIESIFLDKDRGI